MEHADFGEQCARNRSSGEDRSIYRFQTQRVFSFFGRSNFLILRPKVSLDLLKNGGGRGGYKVKLNVYDLSQGLARQLSTTFLGKAIEAICGKWDARKSLVPGFGQNATSSLKVSNGFLILQAFPLILHDPQPVDGLDFEQHSNSSSSYRSCAIVNAEMISIRVVVYGTESIWCGIQQDPAGRTRMVHSRVVDLGVTHVPKEVFEDYLQEISGRYTRDLQPS
ncbi:hypothetical protein ACMD2_24285 [Ananas comosus]|uniref:Uncharacterized protein n=1 Tax=Ananas comosus TaxID=4615 RepID=A0A199V8H8_ANACO|nr:hypothetical protein ACMD2_24285 [Ananas comosus]